MIPERRLTVRRGLAWAGLCLLVLSAVRIAAAWWDLRQPAQREAWRTIQEEHVWDFISVTDDPRAVALWLAAGRDPLGNDCAGGTGRPPDVLSNALFKPLGLCRPDHRDSIPFQTVIGEPSRRRTESLRLMLATGVDVNEVSPGGLVALHSAVLSENVEVVRMLLDHGADPDVRPKHSDIGEYASAWEAALSAPDSAEMFEIRRLLEKARLRLHPLE